MTKKLFNSLQTLRKHLTWLNTPITCPPSELLDLVPILISGSKFFKNVESCVMNNGRSTG